MKKIILITFFLLMCSFVVQAQKFKTHKVKDGETIETIAKQYLVTPFDIYALNPDAKNKFVTNLVLIIPSSKVKNEELPETTKEVIDYKIHKVKRKETLYSLSQKYNIEIDEIKKHNTFLYSENLKRKDKIRIPRFKTIVSKVTLNNTLKTYRVLPKEGKWRVAYKFGISVEELEALNPAMTEVLQPNVILYVPNIANNEEKTIDDDYNYYTVLKSEGYLALFRKFGLTQGELEALNPELKDDGLKLGMLIKIPKDVNEINESINVDNTNLASNLSNLKTKRLALMLPFRLDRIDVDSIAETKEIMKKDRFLSMSLDYYSGVLIALDSAKYLGISTNLKVFDTRNQPSEITKIINANDFSNYDVVIGPMQSNNFERMAYALRGDLIPIVSPLTPAKNLYKNVFQTLPSKDLLSKTMIDFMKSDSLKTNTVIIADQKHRSISNALKMSFPNAKQIFTRKNKDNNDAYHINLEDFEGLFGVGNNIAILETTNEGFASSVISKLNSLIDKECKIILMTTNKNKAFEGHSIDNVHLSNLNFHYPSINKTVDATSSNSFVKQYKSIYGLSPNKYAVRGFDLTLDILLRLASEDDLYEASTSDIETEYVENKFRYSKKSFGGYYNEAVYIVKYVDLEIVEAKE